MGSLRDAFAVVIKGDRISSPLFDGTKVEVNQWLSTKTFHELSSYEIYNLGTTRYYGVDEFRKEYFDDLKNKFVVVQRRDRTLVEFKGSLPDVCEWLLNHPLTCLQCDVYDQAAEVYTEAQKFVDEHTSEVVEEKEAVNHPSHYNQYEGLEIIDLCEQMNFNRGNAVKYIARAGFKDPNTEIQDLMKARFYIEREIQRLEKKQ